MAYSSIWLDHPEETGLSFAEGGKAVLPNGFSSRTPGC